MISDVQWWQVVASMSLVLIVLAISLWRRLGLERSIVWAIVRASAQLIGVGLILGTIIAAPAANWLAAGWVLIMIMIAAWTIRRRARSVPQLELTSIAGIGVTVAVVLLVVFGLGVMEPSPMSIIVIAGITIGNTMPAAVQAVDRTKGYLIDNLGEIEAMLALGFTAEATTRRSVAEVVRSTLIPQIERTKVVWLIALPGAMTGLLLGGVDPMDAVLIQLVVMVLVLGATAMSVVIMSLMIARRAITSDLRVAPWVQAPNPGTKRR